MGTALAVIGTIAAVIACILQYVMWSAERAERRRRAAEALAERAKHLQAMRMANDLKRSAVPVEPTKPLIECFTVAQMWKAIRESTWQYYRIPDSRQTSADGMYVDELPSFEPELARTPWLGHVLNFIANTLLFTAFPTIIYLVAGAVF